MYLVDVKVAYIYQNWDKMALEAALKNKRGCRATVIIRYFKCKTNFYVAKPFRSNFIWSVEFITKQR